MPVTGNIRDFGLTDVLGLLSRSHRTGLLSLSGTRGEVCIYLREGKLVHITTPHEHESLGDLLLRYGRLTPSQRAELLPRHGVGAISSKRAGIVLVERRVLTQEEIVAFLRQRAGELFFPLFLWKDAAFTFLSGERMPEGEIELNLEMEPLILEGLHRQDEWESLTAQDSHPQMVLHRVVTQELPQATVLSPDQWRVLARIDGQMTLAEIARDLQAHLPPTAVRAIVTELLGLGLVTREQKMQPLRRATTFTTAPPVAEEYYPFIYPDQPAGTVENAGSQESIWPAAVLGNAGRAGT